MPTTAGSHSQPGHGGRTIRYQVDYEVIGATIHYRATFEPGDPHEGQFSFDPSKLKAAAAVDAFMQNHIAKSDFDCSP